MCLFDLSDLVVRRRRRKKSKNFGKFWGKTLYWKQPFIEIPGPPAGGNGRCCANRRINCTCPKLVWGLSFLWQYGIILLLFVRWLKKDCPFMLPKNIFSRNISDLLETPECLLWAQKQPISFRYEFLMIGQSLRKSFRKIENVFFGKKIGNINRQSFFNLFRINTRFCRGIQNTSQK